METKRVQLLPLKKAAFIPQVPVDVQQEIIHMIPSTKEVLDQVIPNYITGNIYGCLVESYASENNARMTAMQSSTDNAKEMLRDLSIQYNRARQAAITQERNFRNGQRHWRKRSEIHCSTGAIWNYRDILITTVY